MTSPAIAPPVVFGAQFPTVWQLPGSVARSMSHLMAADPVAPASWGAVPAATLGAAVLAGVARRPAGSARLLGLATMLIAYWSLTASFRPENASPPSRYL